MSVSTIATSIPFAVSTLAVTLASAIAGIASAAAGITGHVCQLIRHSLAGLDHDISNLTSLLCFVGCKQGDGQTLLTCTSSTTNTMDIILCIVGGIKIDDHLHTLDIQSSGSHVRCHHDWGPPILEGGQSCITLPLLAVSMDGDARDAVAAFQSAGQLVAHPFCGSEHQNSVTSLDLAGKQFHQLVLFLPLAANDGNPLLNVGISLKSVGVSNLHVCRITEEFLGQPADFSRPSCSEHHRLTTGWNLGDNHADLRLKTHVKHPISFIQHKIKDRPQPHCSHLQEIVQPTGGGNQHMSPSAKLAQLRSLRSPTIRARTADASRVAKLLGLNFDLARQLTGRREGQQQRPTSTVRIQALLDHGLECWKQEPKRLSGTSLGDTNQIPSLGEQGPGVGLNRRWMRKTSIQQGVQDLRREVAILKVVPRCYLAAAD
mmetsp:Transcript_72387/g.121520  ORF Transcript_72387/g.121520 Transcript_72387/m.121520 type:complete len:431 (+) Transcript_72387:1716-3008(+)